MIGRYAQPEIAGVWDDPQKLAYWQETELAVIQAGVILGKVPKETYKEIAKILGAHPIDIAWWLERENVVRHDLNAFIDERLRFLPAELQIYFHKGITSYDTEEPAFARMLKASLRVVKDNYSTLEEIIKGMASRYRYTIMNGRTHGQEAELQTFGKRCLTWLQDLRVDLENQERVEKDLRYSKISGAIGNYGSMDPELEKEALRILGFVPFYGATQIMPRELYAPIAQALSQIVHTLDKIAMAIRLGARSGRPIYQEPFGRRQKGSSAMPHKKNTISTEQIEGMARMADGFCQMIIANIKTWEERAIEQSCVERVAWPDLFHIVVHSLRVMKRVLEGLVVYPDNMLWEIINSRGCYASSEAKEVLKELGLPFDLTSEEAYRIVQLAAFNAFEPEGISHILRDSLPSSFIEADKWLLRLKHAEQQPPTSIQTVIAKGQLKTSAQLEATEKDVSKWNDVLKKIFERPENRKRWDEVFLPSYLLRNEATLYREILGI